MPGSAHHAVGFYEHDGFLVDLVADFVVGGVSQGEAALVVATRPHCVELARALRRRGVDAAAATAEGRLTILDADEVAAGVLVDGVFSPRRFTTLVEPLLDRAVGGGREVRVFGEAVAVLWDRGDVASALELEDAWNTLGATRSFELFCAYPLAGFATPRSSGEFLAVCQRHTAVTNESYLGLATPGSERHTVMLRRTDHAEGVPPDAWVPAGGPS